MERPVEINSEHQRPRIYRRQNTPAPRERCGGPYWLPVRACQLSPGDLATVTVLPVMRFSVAGHPNWFELRYALTRLPVRFLARSRSFFLVAFAGIAFSRSAPSFAADAVPTRTVVGEQWPHGTGAVGPLCCCCGLRRWFGYAASSEHNAIGPGPGH